MNVSIQKKKKQSQCEEGSIGYFSIAMFCPISTTAAQFGETVPKLPYLNSTKKGSSSYS